MLLQLSGPFPCHRRIASGESSALRPCRFFLAESRAQCQSRSLRCSGSKFDLGLARDASSVPRPMAFGTHPFHGSCCLNSDLVAGKTASTAESCSRNKRLPFRFECVASISALVSVASSTLFHKASTSICFENFRHSLHRHYCSNLVLLD